MRWQPVHDGVGDEDPPEIVGLEEQWVTVGVGKPGRRERVDEQFADRGGGERATLVADGPLEQQRHRRVPDPLPDVVGDHQRDRPVGCAQTLDDGAEDVGEFGADQQQSFGVGLGRRDLQQRDQLAGAGQPVFGDAVVAEFEQFLAADAGQPQDFDGGERPERFLVLVGQVAPFAGDEVLGPDVSPDGFGDEGFSQLDRRCRR